MNTISDTATQTSFETVAQVWTEGRTTHSFVDQEVSPELIEQVIDALRWGPTAMNAGPMRVVQLRSAESRARLAPYMSTGNRRKTEIAPLTLLIAADNNFHQHFDVLAPHMPNAVETWENMEQVRVQLARDNAHLQAGYLITALRAAGLSIGPMSGFDAAGIDKEFFSGTGLKTIMAINVGHGAQDIAELGHAAVHPRGARLSVEQIVTTL